jgi:protoporphyrinogen oxidase
MDLIVGAGITGLSYAAYTTNDYIIIEKDKEVGGYCKTIKQDGFVWDYSGHFFHFQDESIKNDIFNGMDMSEVLTVNKNTQIKYKDRMVDYPFQKNIHQLPQSEFIDCLYDLFQNPVKDYATFKEMLYAKFGKSIAEKFLIPYNEKLYACDLNTLDTDAMGRFFPFADKEDIIANFKPKAETSYNANFLYPKGGAIEYVYSVCKRVDMSKVYLNEYIEDIDLDNKIAKTNKRKIHFDNLISTTPFPFLLKLTKTPFEQSLYTCNKVLVFNIGFDRKSLETRNNWIYYPEKKYVFYRVGFYDNIFNSDRLSVYVEIGYKENDSIDEKVAFDRTIHDLQEAGITTSEHKVVSYKTIIMNPAYVHVTKQMEEDRAIKMARLAEQSVYSIGRYGSWIYCSIEDNIKQAKELAHKLNSKK